MAELIINGAAPTGIYVGSTPASAVYYGNVKVWEAGLPAKTMRFDFKYDHFDPTTELADRSDIGATWTHVADDVYDFHYGDSVWHCSSGMSPTSSEGGLFNIYSIYTSGSSRYFPMNQHSYDIIDSNLSGVTDANHLMTSARAVVNCVLKNTGDIVDASYMLSGGNKPTALATLNALDLHSATTISYLLYGAKSLVSPLNITLGGAITDCSSAFNNCNLVPSGAKALYDVLSTQTTLPTDYNNCFTGCGRSAAQDAPIHAEMDQIPSSWGGTMAP
jgi:hypothetical protein